MFLDVWNVSYTFIRVSVQLLITRTFDKENSSKAARDFDIFSFASFTANIATPTKSTLAGSKNLDHLFLRLQKTFILVSEKLLS